MWHRVVADHDVPSCALSTASSKLVAGVDAKVLDRVADAFQVPDDQQCIVFGVFDEEHAQVSSRTGFGRHMFRTARDGVQLRPVRGRCRVRRVKSRWRSVELRMPRYGAAIAYKYR